jgi:pyruvate kinase
MPDDPVKTVNTKIVATVGPASDSFERLRELLVAGVDVFRLNLAHGAAEGHRAVLARIQQAAAELQRPVAVLADLAGPKIRLGDLPGGKLDCQAGQTLIFKDDIPPAGSVSHLTSTVPGLTRQLRVGDAVLLVDGTVSLRVEELRPGEAVCRVVQPGQIRSRGGINLPGTELGIDCLTDKDLADLDWAAREPIDYFGLSFVRRAGDVVRLREELARRGSAAHIVAKIEKPQAVAALDEIVAAADALMVARGDLGVETDVARIAIVQKQVIHACQRAGIPVITATQMLESMRSNRLPTRAEATDVANAVLDGTDAVMLSAETAVGDYPVEAVAMMNRIAWEAEQLLWSRAGDMATSARGGAIPPVPHALAHASAVAPLARPHGTIDPVTGALAQAAVQVGAAVGARLMIVATRSGRTARALSNLRGRTPLLGVSDRTETVRRLCLYWGVTPRELPTVRDNAQLLDHVVPWALRQNVVAPGERVLLLASTDWSASGHNAIVVHEVPA